MPQILVAKSQELVASYKQAGRASKKISSFKAYSIRLWQEYGYF
jgi:hypothetical protein